MKPIVKLTVDGKPMTGAFYERLIKLTVVDKEGVKSDTFNAELHDDPNDFLELPRKGAIVIPSFGYEETGVQELGKFTVDQVNGKCLPYGLTINGKAADLKSGKLKENKERHWEDKTLGDVVKDIATDAKLTPKIAETLAKIKIPWVAQLDETPIHFLERLALKNNALFTVKDGNLVFAERGTGKAQSGAELPTLTITPDMVVRDTFSFEYNDRGQFKKVTAYYQDKDKAKRVEVDADGDEEGEDTYRIPETFKDAAEADSAAQSKAKQLKRGGGSFSVTLEGDVNIRAGMFAICQDIRPGVDGVKYVIETATHTYSKGDGYQVELECKMYEKESTSGKAKKSDAKSTTPSKKGGVKGGKGEVIEVG